MKRIAFVLKYFQDNKFHGGGEKLFYKLINKFIEDGFIIDIYCSKSNVIDYPGINNIIVIDKEYNHLKPETMEKFYDEAKLLIKNENYDEIISENITPPIGITFLQGHSLINRKNNKNFIERFLYNFRPVKISRIKYQNKWMKEGYKKILVPSITLKKDIVKNFNYPESKINVIYPGVDIKEDFNESETNKTMVFGLSAPGFKIKGGYVFLNALGILKQKGFKFKAKIIYPKHDKNFWVKALMKFYNLKDNVEFLPFQENINDFYNSCDCIVMPSIEETFGFVALEAMSNKKPCIVSDNAGASEIIESKENGFIINMRKSEKHLSEIMRYILKNPEILTKISKNAYDTASEYSWDKFYKNCKNSLISEEITLCKK